MIYETDHHIKTAPLHHPDQKGVCRIVPSRYATRQGPFDFDPVYLGIGTRFGWFVLLERGAEPSVLRHPQNNLGLG